MNAAVPYRLAQGVAFRSERFGALVYRYNNRRLYFIHSQDVADFVAGLDGARPLEEAVKDFVAHHALPASTEHTLFHTIGQLERMGIVSNVPSA
jgi:putative mycofactocin binding protein MftB